MKFFSRLLDAVDSHQCKGNSTLFQTVESLSEEAERKATESDLDLGPWINKMEFFIKVYNQRFPQTWKGSGANKEKDKEIIAMAKQLNVSVEKVREQYDKAKKEAKQAPKQGGQGQARNPPSESYFGTT